MTLDGVQLCSISIQHYVSHLNQLLTQMSPQLGLACVGQAILNSQTVLHNIVNTRHITITVTIHCQCTVRLSTTILHHPDRCIEIDALDQWCLWKLLGINRYNYDKRWCETDNQATTPFGYCPSTTFLSVRPHWANARWNRCQDLNILENWRRPPGRPRTMWMKTIQQDLKS